LKSAAIREKYQENLVEKFTSYQVSHNCNENWTLFSGHITTAAQEVLRPRKRQAPTDSATKIVRDQFKRTKFDLQQQPNAENRKKLNEVRVQMNSHMKNLELEEYLAFFGRLEDYNLSERIKRTYSFVRMAKKSTSVNIGTYIPLSHWENVLSHQEGP
jgi:hypothetical protein